ncbi:hypothetical protein Poli38472_006114 [Pythium oligandrum]|uniref:Uncharacterized protein n=1 Tax=Pythium oligandrum TaxID=41045 RepID=A0A8K1CRT5_PYTOL|nr:hypothetical protein Poli38472_006114 [Pythium oligandrum]|eukprot:TMW68646.1 hypothetical protein Poli38472_006114 [Pythium oligandrum]
MHPSQIAMELPIEAEAVRMESVPVTSLGLHGQDPHAQDQRKLFMKLLRSGVQDKLQNKTQSDGPAAAWQALSWRNAQALEPFFEETVCGQTLRVKQLLQGELTGFGTGLTVWPAACMLLKHLEHRYGRGSNSSTEASLESKLVVELGCGTGVVGIAAAMLGAKRVVLTDVQKLLFLLQMNADLARDLSGGRTNIEVETYDWGASPSARLLTEDGSSPDFVVISDCILPKLYPIEPLVEALDRLTGINTTVLISYEHRHYEQFHPKLKFWELLTARGFEIREIDQSLYHPQYYADDIEIWEAHRNSESISH